MLTNDQMISGRFAKLARGRRLIRAFNAAWDAGRSIQFTTYLRSTIYRAKHRGMVKMDRRGSILIQSGKNWNCADGCAMTVI